METNETRLRDEKYAAAYLNLSLSTIRRMRHRRAHGETGPAAGPAYVVILTAVRYPQADLDGYIAALPRAGAAAGA